MTYFKGVLGKEAVSELLCECMIEGSRRGETLEMVEFARAANIFYEKTKSM